MALIETCAFALAIMATDVGGTSEVVVDGKKGVFSTSEKP